MHQAAGAMYKLLHAEIEMKGPVPASGLRSN